MAVAHSHRAGCLCSSLRRFRTAVPRAPRLDRLAARLARARRSNRRHASARAGARRGQAGGAADSRTRDACGERRAYSRTHEAAARSAHARPCRNGRRKVRPRLGGCRWRASPHGAARREGNTHCDGSTRRGLVRSVATSRSFSSAAAVRASVTRWRGNHCLLPLRIRSHVSSRRRVAASRSPSSLRATGGRAASYSRHGRPSQPTTTAPGRRSPPGDPSGPARGRTPPSHLP
jgi:hypothetical protein